jgi:molybdate transport system substrate-binding protein
MTTVHLFATNSLRGALDRLIPQFERAHAHTVSISYDPAKLMLERVRRGETADLAMLGASAIDALLKEGKLAAGSRRPVAQCGVGVGVRAGAKQPDIGSVDAFRNALLAAKAVAWTTDGVSGIYFSELIERMGIADALRAKALTQPGGLVGHFVVEGKAELAVQQIPELLAVPGIELVGPLPKDIQRYTVSASGVFTDAKQPGAARALQDFLTSPEAGQVFKAAGHEAAVEG